MPKVTVVPGCITPDVEMRFIELAFGTELLISLLDVRRLVEEATQSLRETWDRHAKFVRPTYLDAQVLVFPVELTPAVIWPNGAVDLVTMGSTSSLTEELLPDIKLGTQVDYYVRFADPARLAGRLPSGILARIRTGQRDNPHNVGHVDAIMAYNRLTFKSHP